MNKTLKIITLVSSSLLLACSTQKKEDQEKEQNLTFVDYTVKPGDNFFKFVNGKWLKTVQIPDDKTTWGGFNELRELTDKNVQTLINKAITLDTLNANSDEAKAIELYKSIINIKQRNLQGISPIVSAINKTNEITDANTLQNYIAYSQPLGQSVFFGIGVSADAKNQ